MHGCRKGVCRRASSTIADDGIAIGSAADRCLLSGVVQTSHFAGVRTVFDPKLRPSIPHRSALRCSLFLERSTPRARTYADRPSELSREMGLIAEAALRGHIGERQPVIAQLFLGQHDALLT
jgi:hypothetical protein